MKIIFLPQRRDDTIILSKNGDSLRISGELMDFSGVEEGQTLPVEHGDGSIDSVPHPMIHMVARVDGELIISIVLPHGQNPPKSLAFPDILFDVEDGPIQIPN